MNLFHRTLPASEDRPPSAVVMSTNSISGVVRVLRDCRVLEPAQLEELLRNLQTQFPDPRALAKELLQRGWLTPYQANQLVQGKGTELVLGPYLILEPLGEGANGQVFKARHQTMNRTVALKILRKDLLTDTEAVNRFYREIEVTSRVSHPHIVHAFDAGPIGGSHVLAMEYVDGCDLDRLVREKGPLSFFQACDYIRQAAVGLQHAHEKGLVHRDIKPSNLLASRNPERGTRNGDDSSSEFRAPGSALVKILDLGLARLQEYAKGSKTSNLTKLAGNSVMMGTPDYLAPEQALDFHRADIRSDIYSLGCTLYFLLTGQPPFPGKTLPEKLMMHQQSAPPSIAKARPGAPAGLGPILEKMLAKEPRDRYQTPGEIAVDLTALLGTLSEAEGASGGGGGVLPRKNGSSLRIRKETVPPSGLTPLAPGNEASRRSTSKAPDRRFSRLTLGGGAVLLTSLAVFGILLLRSGPPLQTHEGSSGSATKPIASATLLPPQPTLIFECGKGNNGDAEVKLRRPGYDCKRLNGANHDGWDFDAFRTHCWHDKQELKVEITVPPGTAGTLRLWLVDGDSRDRKERVVVQGKTIGEYEKFGKEGKEVTVPISAEDAKSGKIALSLVDVGPHSVAVSVIEFSPQPNRPGR